MEFSKIFFMRRWLLVLLVALFPTSGLFAQSLADVTEQLLLDVQKLTALKQILTQMYDEYVLVYRGYEDIKGLSQGTFTLHKAFLDGLLVVSAAVTGDPKVPDIIAKEASLIKACQGAGGYWQGTGRFSPGELSMLSNRYSYLMKESAKNLSELYMVITDGALRMNDAERLSAIDRIDGEMTGRLAYLRTLDDQTALIAAQRAREQATLGTVGALYGQ